MKKVLFLLGILLIPVFARSQKTDSISDARDGEVYRIVKIGNQWWMAENLRAISMPDSTPLVPGNGLGDITGNDSTAYYFWYQDDSLSFSQAYGALYTWASAMNLESGPDTVRDRIQGVCPTGWHLPSDEDWKRLELVLGMDELWLDSLGWRGTNEGGKLKETGYQHWNSPNLGASNESGFRALPAGYRHKGGEFRYLRYDAYFWSATQADSGFAYARAVNTYHEQVMRHNVYNKEHGFSIRCVMDSDCTYPEIESSHTHPSCFGSDDASAEIAIEGEGPMKVSWSTGDTTLAIEMLNAGLYSYTVIDSAGCTYTDSLQIEDPPLLEATISDSADVSCFGQQDGMATVTTSGGTAPYYYYWNTAAGDTGATVQGLSGNRYYAVSVSDLFECTAVDSVYIGEPDKVITSDITGPGQVNSSEIAIYAVSEKPGSGFNWIIKGGNLVSGHGTNLINVQWGSSDSGMVSVVETDPNGCQGDTVRRSIDIVATSVHAAGISPVRIYPNPFREKTMIEITGDPGDGLSLTLTDPAGRIVRYQQDLKSNKIMIRRGTLSPGLYFIRIGRNEMVPGESGIIFRGKVVIE